jgi:hypothetical protein
MPKRKQFIDPGAVAILRGSPNAPEVDGSPPVPLDLDEVIAAFRKWLYLPDASALKMSLGAVAANLLPGDPLWLLLVGATGSGKTELLDSLMGLPNMHPVGTLTQAALLSGTPQREKAKDASGGILRKIGAFGFLILKDFTSVLATSGEIRGPLLAALREVADGHWTRSVGADGARDLHWSGKCALIAGCTPSIDTHHSLMAMMGERFLLFRMPSMDEETQAERAMLHVNREKTMRRELRQAVSRLFGSIRPEPHEFDEAARKRLAALSKFVARARSAVERDRYHRDIELIPSSEMPGRLARSLRCLFQGLQNIGVPDQECWTLVSKTALDCIPDLRWQVLRYLLAASQEIETSRIADGVNYPTTTARRALEDLTGHGLAHRFGEGSGTSHTWTISSLSRELLAKAKVTP